MNADVALVSNACSKYVHVQNMAALDNQHSSYSSVHTFEKGQLQCSNSKYRKKKKALSLGLTAVTPNYLPKDDKALFVDLSTPTM